MRAISDSPGPSITTRVDDNLRWVIAASMCEKLSSAIFLIAGTDEHRDQHAEVVHLALEPWAHGKRLHAVFVEDGSSATRRARWLGRGRQIGGTMPRRSA